MARLQPPARVLVVAPSTSGSRLTGPEMRALGIAKGLARDHVVTIATNASLDDAAGDLDVVAYDRRSVAARARRSDAVIGPWLPPIVMAACANAKTTLIADLYDPVEFELPRRASEEDAAELARVSRLTELQIRFADVLTCGSETQRRRLDVTVGSHRTPVCTVPFGLPEAPRLTNRHPLRERFAEINEKDFVLLWWGSPWRWLDLQTAIRAVAEVDADKRVRLVITAGAPASAEARARLSIEASRQLARELEVLGTRVFFLEEWIPFAERHEWLADADAGITMHADQGEATLAVRARYLDYLWCGLPCILSEGDDISRSFAEAGFARLVAAGDHNAAALALTDWATDRRKLADAKQAGARLAEQLRWDSVVKPLVAELRRGQQSPRSSKESVRLYVGAARYYAYLAYQAAAGRAGRRR